MWKVEGLYFKLNFVLINPKTELNADASATEWKGGNSGILQFFSDRKNLDFWQNLTEHVW